MPADLSVNLNAVAMLRNRRNLPWPSVVGIARLCLEAGAEGVTVHPRPDERHTRKTDVYDLKELVANEFPDREFNVEGFPDEQFMALVEEVAPHQVTLVPDDPAQATSDHGWDLHEAGDMLAPLITRLKGVGSRVSLFIDADPQLPQLAAQAGADRIELYTGPFALAHLAEGHDTPLEHLRQTAEQAKEHGLGVNAGHDLTLNNLPLLVGAIPHLAEVSIGHGITADALLMGFGETVRQYRGCLRL